MSTPAGWYPDPQAEGQQRYWDGNAWTEHQAPLVQPQQPTQPTQPTEPAWTAPTQGAPYAQVCRWRPSRRSRSGVVRGSW